MTSPWLSAADSSRFSLVSFNCTRLTKNPLVLPNTFISWLLHSSQNPPPLPLFIALLMDFPSKTVNVGMSQNIVVPFSRSLFFLSSVTSLWDASFRLKALPTLAPSFLLLTSLQFYPGLLLPCCTANFRLTSPSSCLFVSSYRHHSGPSFFYTQ